jgi:hypothetical protein
MRVGGFAIQNNKKTEIAKARILPKKREYSVKLTREKTQKK